MVDGPTDAECVDAAPCVSQAAVVPDPNRRKGECRVVQSQLGSKLLCVVIASQEWKRKRIEDRG